MEVKPITILYENKEITLIPTAHVSKDSSILVEQVINAIQPDSICIELDQQRYNSLKEPETYRNTDIVNVIKEKRVILMIVNLILANYQKRMASSLDSNSGQEMLVGIRKSEELKCRLVLADRPVTTTFKRVWANLSFKEKLSLLEVIISSLFDDKEISEEDLKKLQQTDMLNSLIDELSKQLPSVIDPLIVERDKYLAYKIKNAYGNKIVAVLGAAHTIGIQKYIYEDYDISEFDKIPEKKAGNKILSWIIPVALVILIIASFSIDPNFGWKQLLSLLTINGTLSAIFTLLCGGHPLTVLVAFICAPIAVLNPFLANGWFTGLTESYLRKPTIADFDNISKDMTSLKGILKNRVTRILLIFIFSSIGSSLGTIILGSKLISSLIKYIS